MRRQSFHSFVNRQVEVLDKAVAWPHHHPVRNSLGTARSGSHDGSRTLASSPRFVRRRIANGGKNILRIPEDSQVRSDVGLGKNGTIAPRS